MLLVNSTIKETREQIAEWKNQGLTIGFVPTMGALHIGHMSLVKEAKKACDKVVVSVFVNPTQFGPNEDFECYPRTLDSDKKICSENGVDMIFAPSAKEMYPSLCDSSETTYNKSESLTSKYLTTVKPPENFTNKLCGKSRLGHFDGVATVVVKLLNIIQPDKAFFGQKDAQQLAIIKQFTHDLNIPVDIIPCPIKREPDGLACSSRNKYLTQESRQKATSIYRLLKKVKELHDKGVNNINEVSEIAINELHPDISLEYLEFLNADSMQNQVKLSKNTLVALAVKLDNVRLIDNIVV